MVRNTIQIQAWLNRQKVGEADACETLLEHRERGWKDRYTITQALNALKMLEEQGWQPAPPMDEVHLTADMVNLLRSVQLLAAKLASMDFSNAQVRSVSQELEIVSRELTAFEKSASALMGNAVFFDDEDE